MKNEIEQIIVNHIDRKISLGEATTQILRLFAVSNQREQLIAFRKWMIKNECTKFGTDDFVVNEFLKSN